MLSKIICQDVSQKYGFIIALRKGTTLKGDSHVKIDCYYLYIDDKLITSFEEKSKAVIAYQNILSL